MATSSVYATSDGKPCSRNSVLRDSTFGRTHSSLSACRNCSIFGVTLLSEPITNPLTTPTGESIASSYSFPHKPSSRSSCKPSKTFHHARNQPALASIRSYKSCRRRPAPIEPTNSPMLPHHPKLEEKTIADRYPGYEIRSN